VYAALAVVGGAALAGVLEPVAGPLRVTSAVNPTTVVYFAAVVLGNRDLVSTFAEGVLFVTAAFLASASWQLVLAAGGAALGALATGHRGRLVTGLVSAAVIAGLAIWTLLG
jgi:arginine exporter protein ArgO